MRIRINDIAYHLPGKKLTGQDLAAMHPDWDMEKIEEKTGVRLRHVLAPGQTLHDISAKACKKLLDRNPGLQRHIDGIIFNATCSDLHSPKNSFLIQRELDLPHHVFCLDTGMACSGFIYSLAVARGLIATGVAKNFLIVAADTLTKYTLARSCKSIFSDGASASWISPSDSSRGLIDADFGALGKAFDAAFTPYDETRIPVPRAAESDVAEQMVMNGKKILNMVGSHVPRQVRKLLKRNDLTIDEIDLFIFHQGSKLMVDTLARLLRIPPEKVFRNYDYTGNTSSASIPIALRDARDQNRAGDGDLVLIAGFGAGFSWGTAILKL